MADAPLTPMTPEALRNIAECCSEGQLRAAAREAADLWSQALSKLRGCELGRDVSAEYHDRVRREFDLPDPSTNAIVDRLRAEIAKFRARETADAEIARLTGSCVSPQEKEKLFPIMGGPPIPWSLIAACEAQAQHNHSQSVQRLAERGGLDPWEAVAIITGQDYRLAVEKYAGTKTKQEQQAVTQAGNDVLAAIVYERYFEPLKDQVADLSARCARLEQEKAKAEMDFDTLADAVAPKRAQQSWVNLRGLCLAAECHREDSEEIDRQIISDDYGVGVGEHDRAVGVIRQRLKDLEVRLSSTTQERDKLKAQLETK